MLPNEYQHGCEQKEFITCSTIESVNNKFLHPPPPQMFITFVYIVHKTIHQLFGILTGPKIKLRKVAGN